MDCVFCAIVSGAEPAWVVSEDEDTIAFLDIAPAAPGHTLVIPKRHVADIWDADGDTFTAVARMTHRVAALLDERLQPDGMTLFQANRAAGWQTVFHLHVHVVPRYTTDDLSPPWRPTMADRSALATIGQQLQPQECGRGAARSQGHGTAS